MNGPGSARQPVAILVAACLLSASGALLFNVVLQEFKSKAFHKKPKEEQAHLRQEKMKALEAPTADVPLTDRFGSF